MDKKNKRKTEPADKEEPRREAANEDFKDATEKPPGIEDLEKKLEAEKERTLRLSAEFDNYKKRKQREIDDFKKFANEAVFKQLLAVMDNLERAVNSAKNDNQEDDSSLLEGVELTLKETERLFETFNIKPVNAKEQPFDPNFHQAVTQVETDEFPDSTVTSVLQKGYLLHDRLIRPAMVVVSKKPEKTEEEKEIKEKN